MSERKIADMDAANAKVISAGALAAIREEYWTRGGIACEKVFLSHEKLRAQRDRAIEALDMLVREIGGDGSKWAEALNLASGVLLEARRFG